MKPTFYLRLAHDWNAKVCPDGVGAQSVIRVILSAGGSVVRDGMLGPWKAGAAPLHEPTVAALVDAGILEGQFYECS